MAKPSIVRCIEKARAARARLDGRAPPQLLRPELSPAAEVADVDALVLLVLRRVLRVLAHGGYRRRGRRVRFVAR